MFSVWTDTSVSKEKGSPAVVSCGGVFLKDDKLIRAFRVPLPANLNGKRFKANNYSGEAYAVVYALAEALKSIPDFSQLKVYTDTEILVRRIVQGANFARVSQRSCLFLAELSRLLQEAANRHIKVSAEVAKDDVVNQNWMRYAHLLAYGKLTVEQVPTTFKPLLPAGFRTLKPETVYAVWDGPTLHEAVTIQELARLLQVEINEHDERFIQTFTRRNEYLHLERSPKGPVYKKPKMLAFLPSV